MDAADLTMDLPDADAATAFAQALAGVLRPGDTLLLDGPLGAGKSHIARAIVQSLQAPFGAVEDVPSPTYTLVQSYAAGPTEIVHADLYRLAGPGEVAELGLADTFGTAITLVEWPDRLGGVAPDGALCIALTHRGEGRLARLTGRGWRDRLARIAVVAHG